MRFFAAVLTVMLLAGCAGPDIFEASDPPAVEVVGTLAPERIWERDIGAASGLRDRLAPAYADGRLYVASADGTIMALDADSGEPLWQRELGKPLSGGPSVGGDLVVIGSRKGDVFALSAQDGAPQWHADVTSEVLAPAAVGSQVVVVRSNDGAVSAFERDSGERRWLYDRNVPALSVRGHSAPVLVEGGVIVGLDNGRLVALSLDDGAPLWEAPVAVPRGQTDLDRMVDVDADPLVRRDAVFAMAYQGRVVGIALQDGRVAWARDMSGYSGLAMAERRLLLSDDQGRVWALDPSNGASIWRQDALEGIALTGPTIQNGYPVVCGGDGYVTWLSANDGRVLARRYVADTRLAATPVAADGVLYTLAIGGTLVAWKLPSG